MKTLYSSKLKTCFVLVALISSNCLISQNYLRGFGLRVGGYAAYQGLTYKEFLTPNLSLETVLGKNTGTDAKNFSLQANFHYNKSINRLDYFTFYAGAGPKVMYWYKESDYINRNSFYIEKETNYRLAINTLVGVEAKIGNLPISTAIDFGPSIFVYPYVKTNLMLNASIFYVVENHKFTAHSHLAKRSYSKHRRHH